MIGTVKAGGIFIHHVDTETTLQKLHDLLGILTDNLPKEESYTDGSWRIWKP
jgi:hypothetical protein